MAPYAGMGPIADHALAQLPSVGGLYYDLVAQIELDRFCRGPGTPVAAADTSRQRLVEN
ncbi:hypothetical protein [Catellatospora sichuanensis]|uniref:hypothetical protein n=1 Tax=Catellatospora sichuanensis TaxID=1969805 RepID=UPI0016430C1D|nr:hypothetical protein [Catellatospora sichuanensis]